MSRNLLKYPVTKEEVKELLGDLLKEELSTLSVGGQLANILSGLIRLTEDRFDPKYFNPQ